MNCLKLRLTSIAMNFAGVCKLIEKTQARIKDRYEEAAARNEIQQLLPNLSQPVTWNNLNVDDVSDETYWAAISAHAETLKDYRAPDPVSGLTLYEHTQIVGTRAAQLEFGAPSRTVIDPLDFYSSAKREIDEGHLDKVVVVKRRYADGSFDFFELGTLRSQRNEFSQAAMDTASP